MNAAQSEIAAEAEGANPLHAGLTAQSPPEPHTVVIFGGSGDLAARKLVPAFYNLQRNTLLPSRFAAVGLGRRDIGDTYRERLREAAVKYSRTGPPDPELWEAFAAGISYLSGDFSAPAAYQDLANYLKEIEAQRGIPGNRVFYLATQPSLFPDIIRQLGDAGLAHGPGTTRIVIEKPFGSDLESARVLNSVANSVFDESQIYRIDHYLGKETVQNVLVFRFANAIFEPIWNRRYVDHVQFTVAESAGVEDRGSYYEEAGALRDMVQNHMLQLLAVVAMEPPVDFGADSVRDEKVKVLRAVRRMSPDEVRRNVVRASYGVGFVGGEEVPGYRAEPDIAPDSTTDTYAAARFLVDSWRWEGVPFFLRTGKRLPKRVTEIALQFKRVPHLLFDRSNPAGIPPNALVMHIQPEEGIAITFEAKRPGPAVQVQPVRMDFGYGEGFAVESPDAYERLLLDVMLGDQTLFTRRDETEAAWAAVMPVLDAWESGAAPEFHVYEAGSWGPEAADDLIEASGFRWRRI